MLVSLMRSMKPKVLESFKDYNAQKEFLAKIANKKQIIVELKADKNIITQTHPEMINKILKENKNIIVYKSNTCSL